MNRIAAKRIDGGSGLDYNAESVDAIGAEMSQTVHEPQWLAVTNPTDVLELAHHYVTTQLGDQFVISKPRLLPAKPIWWMLIQYQTAGEPRPIGVGQIQVDAHTGQVIPLSETELAVIGEKAALLEARQQGDLPVDAAGHVLGEYARKQASRYLWAQLGMYYRASDPVFLPGEPPMWQVTIVFKMYELGPYPLGPMKVNGRSGEPVPLSATEIAKLRDRVHAIIGHQTSPAKPG
jgi:hypothetical protein